MREREKECKIAAMDDSCRRPGSIPFKWEICPGTPKHTRSASAASSKVAPKLTPPPFMASPSYAPSPYHSPRVSYAARSASVSPSRRGHGGHRRPTAFIDLAPRPRTTTTTDATSEAHEAAVAAYRCFPLPALIRRRDGKKGDGKKGGSGSGSSSSSSGSSFRSDGELGLRRSASSSSSSLSLPLPPGRKFAAAREELEAARGWFF